MDGVTLRDVASRAGVSQPTASRALNGSQRKPAAHIVEAVRRAADELGYIPNAQAQALVRSSSGLIGLVVHDIADPYFSAIAAGAQATSERHDHQMMLAATHRGPERELAAVETLLARRVEAVVLSGSRRVTSDSDPMAQRLSATLERFARNGGRIAVIGQAIAHAHAILPDNFGGAASLAKALAAQADRDYVILSGPVDLATAADRTAGFISGLAESDTAPVAVVPGDFTRDGGHASTLTALRDVQPSRRRPLCIFAVNDVMAVGSMTALAEQGLHVPGDVQVCGFDDIPTLRDHTPGLTTVRLPLQDLGARGVELALTAPQTEPTIEHVHGEVVLRASTG